MYLKTFVTICIICKLTATFFESSNYAERRFFQLGKDVSERDAPQKLISINETEVDSFIETVLDCQPSISALSLAIVQLDRENDTVVASYNRAYGNLAPPYRGSTVEPKQADQHTRFCVGSITKQFTAAVTGLALEAKGKDYDAQLMDVLGDEGRFFNEKGLDRLPSVRDILSHRMSIPGYDTALEVGLPGNRSQYWGKLHKLGDDSKSYLSNKYRSSFEYNNWMVSLAGYITELLHSRSWESVVNETYFQLLSMENATFMDVADFNDNFAVPAYRVKNESDSQNFTWLPIDQTYMNIGSYMSAPAGSICLSSMDMLTYMKFILSSPVDCTMGLGTEDKQDCLKKAALKKKIEQTMYEVSNYIDRSEIFDRSDDPPLLVRDNYALGWFRGYYRAYEMVSHSGGIAGYLSQELIFPKSKVGVFVSTANGFTDAPYDAFVALGLFDMVMGEHKPITAETICNFIKKPPMPNPDDLHPFPGCFDTEDFPDLEPLNGTYSNEVFGDIVILYNRSADEERNRFRYYYGNYSYGMLCPEVKDNEKRNRFTLYADPQSPLWMNNDPTTSAKTANTFIFERDVADRATRLVFPGLEKRAPSVEKQTYYKRDYRPCQPDPCTNGGLCSEKGAFDFVCECPPHLSGVVCEIAPKTDCTDLKKYYPMTDRSGVYQIDIPGEPKPFNVYCDMETDGGGWTVIQRRTNDTEKEHNFNATFPQYVSGIGLPGQRYNYWMGLSAIGALANDTDKNYTLRIELTDCTGKKPYNEEYQNFWLGSSSTKYVLHLKSNSASGTAGDALTVSNSYISHSNMPFSTPDKDNGNGCAAAYSSGWWFNNCFDANLNGIYYDNCNTGGSNTNGIVWLPLHNGKYSMDRVEMKIRRANVL